MNEKKLSVFIYHRVSSININEFDSMDANVIDFSINQRGSDGFESNLSFSNNEEGNYLLNSNSIVEGLSRGGNSLHDRGNKEKCLTINSCKRKEAVYGAEVISGGNLYIYIGSSANDINKQGFKPLPFF
ncbi:Hypothetical predicted protein [Octopus vulgaris]|uniref:Uncharacterized protein n=1 Tax=Octopus vulgaris TaxID=6645 RepID=A0AA36HJ16_OCTVU|nr:Hypothetical predicted protein [Octopus vulgaris]